MGGFSKNIQGGYEEMLMFAHKVGVWVGGVQQCQKHADVIYGWSIKYVKVN